MLVGRQAEKQQLRRLLERARDGSGSAVVLRGEAGIGKTALLQDAAATAEGFLVLHALGVESEAELAFAALHELLLPVLDRLGDLPPPQATALRAALALEKGDRPDRFAAYAGTLGLLAAAAAERPLLCVVDDGHWLDQASAEALIFAARRIEHDAVAMLFAVRDPDVAAFAAPGLAELRLGGLSAGEAKGLLAARSPSLAPAAVDRVVEVSGGNPLALLEFAPRALGNAELEAPLRVDEAVERAFLDRSAALSRESRRAVLLVAANDPAEPETLWRAIEREQLGAALAEAEEAGLVTSGSRTTFAHPLARSAIYHAAPPADRRDVHRVLAETTIEPVRRAWHLAAAASGPDEAVARALEQASATARSRGGAYAQAAALARAATLTPDAESRAERLLKAGTATEDAGEFSRAERLYAEAAELATGEEVRAEATARRSYLLFNRGEFAPALELATREAERLAPATAARVLTASGVVHALIHLLEIREARRVAERAVALAGGESCDDLDVQFMLIWTWSLAGLRRQSLERARTLIERADPGGTLAVDIACRFFYEEDHEAARQHLERIAAHERAVGALGSLAYALDNLALLQARTGPLATAYATSLEALQLIEPFQTDTSTAGCLGRVALIEAMLGRTADAVAHGRRALELAEGRNDRWNIVRARVALGAEAAARGDASATVEWLAPAAAMLAAGGHRQRNNFRVDGELIEAHVRLGNTGEAKRLLHDFLEDADATESPWALAVGARCRALLAEEADVEEAFEAALELHEREPSEWERARTQLAYGERLRRTRRRRAARDQLRAALETFERLGSRPWVDRAGAELRATGERLTRTGPAAHEQLTPQELQVSLAAAEGLTSKEIGARLFLSPRTVDFHLGRVYRKLDVRSRAELIKLFAEKGGAGERVPA
jgi:DNA-binding CsgD family transcriptional regulator